MEGVIKNLLLDKEIQKFKFGNTSKVPMTNNLSNNVSNANNNMNTIKDILDQKNSEQHISNGDYLLNGYQGNEYSENQSEFHFGEEGGMNILQID